MLGNAAALVDFYVIMLEERARDGKRDQWLSALTLSDTHFDSFANFKTGAAYS